MVPHRTGAAAAGMAPARRRPWRPERGNALLFLPPALLLFTLFPSIVLWLPQMIW